MTWRVLICFALMLTAGAAQAACFADYKAKRDGPLRLHYGVAEVTGPCSPGNAQAELAPRLAADGWTLLSVVSVFDASELTEKEENAGEFFLRY
ncbi:MAG: hypothetical protein AAF092_06715 [Pseudomonadota bacterium]